MSITGKLLEEGLYSLKSLPDDLLFNLGVFAENLEVLPYPRCHLCCCHYHSKTVTFYISYD